MISVSNPIISLSEEQKLIFNIIQKKGPISKNKLMALTGMKLTTLNRYMDSIEKSKLIVQNSSGESSGGRKPALYDVNPQHFYMLGIDLSRTYTRLIVTNLKMEILFEKEFQMNESLTPEKTVKKIGEIFKLSLESLSIDIKEILGAGVGTVGPLLIEEGTMLNPTRFNSADWSNIIPIRDMLHKELGIPVFIDNGANTAVLSEFLFGFGKSFKNIAYFNCGIGIRTGVISSDTLVRTMNNAEDAFGHMIIDVDGEPCYCGNYGCIECYSSIFAIIKNFVSARKKGRVSSVNKPFEEISYTDILNAAEKNDELSKEIVTSAALTFGAGLTNYINLLNPGLVILSGPIISNSDLFYRVCTERASKNYQKTGNTVIFQKGCHFGDSAISAGACAMVVESFLGSRILS